MRQIVQIQIGQCGNSIGNCYWKSLCNEANLTQNGLAQNEDATHYLPLYFQERSSFQEKSSHYIARTIFIDTDPTVLDQIIESEHKNIFDQESFIMEQQPSQGVYSNEKTLNEKFKTQIDDRMNKYLEEIDSLQGFQIILGAAGGTGSGIGSFLLDQLKDHYSGMKFVYPILPTILTSRSPLDIYNMILLFPYLQGHPTFLFDNEAIEKTCFNTFYDQTPDFDSMNKLISNAILGTTQNLRYPGKVNSSLQKIVFPLMPLYRLNFITITQAPLMTQCQNTNQLCAQLFNDDQPFFSYYPSEGKYLSCSLILKGNISLSELDSQIYNVQPRESFVKWIPDNIQKTLCSENGELSAMLLSNSTATRFSFKKLLDEFEQLLKNKNYLHIYQNAGIEEQQLTDSMLELKNSYQEYSQYN